jgi:hypothetical protein
VFPRFPWYPSSAPSICRPLSTLIAPHLYFSHALFTICSTPAPLRRLWGCLFVMC